MQDRQAAVVVIECGGGLAIPSVRVQGEARCGGLIAKEPAMRGKTNLIPRGNLFYSNHTVPYLIYILSYLILSI